MDFSDLAKEINDIKNNKKLHFNTNLTEKNLEKCKNASEDTTIDIYLKNYFQPLYRLKITIMKKNISKN